jgi:hypothetical protein
MPEVTRDRQEKSGFVTTFFGRPGPDDGGRQKDRMSANHPLTPASSRINGDPRRQMLMEILEEIRRPASLIIDEG